MTSSLTPEQFDDLTASPTSWIWGAKAIASTIGTSIDKVYALARVPGVPIYKPEGAGYVARPDELEAWMRSKPQAAPPG